MRCIHWRALMVGFVVLGWTAWISRGTAQTYQLISFTNTWRYNALGQDLGTVWREIGYDDTSVGWAGPGLPLFGFETTPAEYPYDFKTTGAAAGFPDPLTVTPYVNTYYFRTHFDFPTNPASLPLTLVSSNFIDDGVVYYLNGTELARIRLTGVVTNGTIAASQAAEGVVEVYLLPGTSVVQGENLLAAEVHQNSAISPDEVFGMSLHAVVEHPLAVTNQPRSQTVAVFKPFSLSVGVSGTFPSYQWAKVGSTGTPNLAGATNATFTITSAQLSYSGNYAVIVSNRFGAITSDVAVVTVVPDTFGPLLLSATVDETNAYALIVQFDEAVLKNSATNMNAWQVRSLVGTNVLTNSLPVTNVFYAGPQIRLNLSSPFLPGSNYVLIINGVRDIAATTNIIAPNSWIGITFNQVSNIFGFDQSWRYDESEFTTPDPSWLALNYNDDPSLNSNWKSGASIFAYSQTGTFSPCAPLNTTLFLGPTTFYFRTKFNSSRDVGPNPIIRLNYLVNDGAVFYLNGMELFRYNMPTGPVTYDTPASVAIQDASCRIFSTNLASGILVNGSNIFAVELHQAVPDFGNDVAFGAALGISFPPTLPPDEPNPTLKIVQVDRAKIGISWPTGHGFALEGATSLSGRWIQVANMTTNMTIPTTNAFQFYRLHRLN